MNENMIKIMNKYLTDESLVEINEPTETRNHVKKRKQIQETIHEAMRIIIFFESSFKDNELT